MVFAATLTSLLTYAIVLPNYTAQLYWHANTRCEEGDVNAIFRFRGIYHIFHQFRNRPHTSIGHQASTDLLHWHRLPDALESGASGDEQCYDGGASLVPHSRTGRPAPMLMIDGGCAKKGPPGPACMESSGNNTGGVIAFPTDMDGDPNLTKWERIGPTSWRPCKSSAWPSPIWLNPVTHKFNLLAVHGFGEARFEAEDESFTRWKLADEAFLMGMRGLGGGMWHALPPNVDGVSGGRWPTHIFQGALGHAFNGLPTFVMGVYDPTLQTYTNISQPVLLDGGGGVDYGQLSWSDDDKAEGRCLFISWLRLTEPTPPDCGTQGLLTAIRDLRYDPRLDTLVHTPIVEYYHLRSAQPIFGGSAERTLKAGAPPVILYSPTASPNSATPAVEGGSTAAVTTTAAATSAGGTKRLAVAHGGVSLDAEFNVSVPASLGGASAKLAVRCGDVATCTGGATVTLGISPLGADGTRWVEMHVDYAYHVTRSFLMLKGEQSLCLRVLSDTRSLEIFAAHGRGVASITMLSSAGIVTAAAETSDLEVVAAGWGMALYK